MNLTYYKSLKYTGSFRVENAVDLKLGSNTHFIVPASYVPVY